MSASILQVIEADCSVLLLRSLLMHKVVAFGSDGLGKHGKNDYPKYFTVKDVNLDVHLADNGDVTGIAYLTLDGYNDSDCGMICSDRNFLISVQNLLQDWQIDRNVLSYAIEPLQGVHDVAMNIDVPLLLDWA